MHRQMHLNILDATVFSQQLVHGGALRVIEDEVGLCHVQSQIERVRVKVLRGGAEMHARAFFGAAKIMS